MKRGMLLLVVLGALVAAVRFAFHAFQAAGTASGIEHNQEQLGRTQPADDALQTVNQAARGYRFQFRDLLHQLTGAAHDVGAS